MRREMASYNKAMPDEKAVVREYMEEDGAMRARFEEWMKAYGRTYKDEVEKARRFKIFKSVVRFTDAFTDDASKAGCSARFGLNEYSDWNAEEVARLSGIPAWRDGGYFKMVMSYLAPQEIWHQTGSANNKVYIPNFIYTRIFVCLIDMYIDWRSLLFQNVTCFGTEGVVTYLVLPVTLF